MKRAAFIIALLVLAISAKAQTVVINSYRFGGFAGVLDPYSSNLMVAHSVSRRLLASYTGALFKVRRSNDNATQDIGYGVDGLADTTALGSFVGSNSGYVVTLFDQSGNGRDLTQSTNAYQFRIVNAGANDTLASKLVMINASGGATVGMYTASTFTTYSGTVLSVFARGLCGSDLVNSRLVGVTAGTSVDYDNSGRAAMIINATGANWTTYRAADLGNTISTPSTSDGLISAIADGTNLKLRDGTNTGSAASSASFSIDRVLVGNYSDALSYCAANTKVAEVIIWTSDQTSNESGIRTAMNY